VLSFDAFLADDTILLIAYYGDHANGHFIKETYDIS
jgi:hypothetical protein